MTEEQIIEKLKNKPNPDERWGIVYENGKWLGEKKNDPESATLELFKLGRPFNSIESVDIKVETFHKMKENGVIESKFANVYGLKEPKL